MAEPRIPVITSPINKARRVNSFISMVSGTYGVYFVRALPESALVSVLIGVFLLLHTPVASMVKSFSVAGRPRQSPETCHAPNFARTFSLTRLPSAFLPASLAMAAFMALPISFAVLAPVSAMAAATAASISSSLAAAGR